MCINTGFAQTKKTHLAVVAAACSFSLLAQNPDIDLLHNFNKNSSPFLDKTFSLVTRTATPFTIAVPVAVFAAGAFSHDKMTMNNSITIAASVLIADGVTTGLKYIFNRPRPYVTYSFIEKKKDAGGPSFPSGHTTTAFATAASLSLAYPKWYVIAPSFLWASGVAYSRMYLGVHYPTDVLGGMVVGIGISYLAFETRKWMERKNLK